MKNSKIEWTDHTINFWWGCTKVSPACFFCYAAAIAQRFGPGPDRKPVKWGKGEPRVPRLEAARREAQALNASAKKRGTRERVFVNSMSDWLDDEVPIEWLAVLLDTIRQCDSLDFQLLTKRPENWKARLDGIADFAQYESDLRQGLSRWIDYWCDGFPPANVWVGTTAEDQTRYEERIEHLCSIPAAVRFMSMEPLLSAVNMQLTANVPSQRMLRWYEPVKSKVHWIICGGESGTDARPMHPDWARSLRDQCKDAGVRFFFKQWGEWAPTTAEPVRGKYTGGGLFLKPKGCLGNQGDWWDGNAEAIDKLGKKASGRLLDGIEHNAFPSWTEIQIAKAP